MSRPERPLALITGASRGIGAAIARRLAPNCDLVLVARSEAAMAELAEEFRSLGATVHSFSCDLSDASSRRALLDSLEPLEISILINNAGIAESAPLAKSDDSLWERSLAINLTAPFELSRALVPAMAARGWGRVVNIASTAALKGYRYTAAYSATKAGLLGLNRSLALDFARKGVTFNSVCPGFTDTDIVASAVANITEKTGQSEAQARDALASFSPQGRLMNPEEIAASVAYLVSDAAAGITGQTLAVDGGETA